VCRFFWRNERYSMAGRPPKPLKIHDLDGTFRADRHARASVAKSTGGNIPPQPKGMDKTAVEMWRYITTTRGDWIAESDGPALQSLCETWSLRCRAQVALSKRPIDKDTRIAFVAYQQECVKLLAKFGATPTDRARLGEQSADELDPAAEFIA
jgi:phage terminase small subunit